jgi:hypothetical protein
VTNNAVISPDRPVFFVHDAPQNMQHEDNSYVGDKLGIEASRGWRQFPNAPEFDLAKGTILKTLADRFDVDDFYLPTKPSDVGPSWMRPGDDYLPEVLKKK